MLFTKLWNKGKELFDLPKCKIAEKGLKRKIESAIDNSTGAILTSQKAIIDMLESVEALDLNAYNKEVKAIEAHNANIEAMKVLYSTLFDKEPDTETVPTIEELIKGAIEEDKKANKAK